MDESLDPNLFFSDSCSDEILLQQDLYFYKQWRDIPKRVTVMHSIQNGTNPPCIVSNVVTYMQLNMKQDQRTVALHAKHILPVFFDPKIFAFSQQPVCLYGYPPVKIMFFSGTKVIILGGLSEDHNRLVARHIVRYLGKKFNIGIELELLSTRNIVANVDMPFSINLAAIAQSLGSRATFDPMLIDCCRVKSNLGGSMRKLIFGTGATLLIGSKNEDNLFNLYLETCEIASKHRLEESVPKGVSQKYEHKKSMLSPESIRLTNIQIENSVQYKRRKINNSKNETKKKIDLEHFDQTYDVDQSMTSYIQTLECAKLNFESPKFLPYSDMPQLEDSK